MTQQIIALTLVIVAAAHILWRGWNVVRNREERKTGCGGCHGCAAGASPSDSPRLVPLEPPPGR